MVSDSAEYVENSKSTFPALQAETDSALLESKTELFTNSASKQKVSDFHSCVGNLKYKCYLSESKSKIIIF